MPAPPVPVAEASREFILDDLSEAVGISKQTLVTWADRGLIEATLDWGVSGANEAVRRIRIAPASLAFLEGFAAEYRADTVSRTEARRLLKLIDRNQVQKLIRQSSVTMRRVKGEPRVDVGSIEDYLRTLEAPGSRAD